MGPQAYEDLSMNHVNITYRLLLVCGLAILNSACNTLSKTDDPSVQISNDPLVSYNRTVYSFNNAADKVILKPISQAYHHVVPDPAERRVGRFFNNLGEPLNIVNNILQGKVDGALNSTYRFVVNSTVGVLGFFDVAASYQVARKPEDFGQTLATWGVKPGPYLMMPLYGPTNLRDGFGQIVSFGAYFPVNDITENPTSRVLLTGLNIVDIRAGLLSTDALLERQLDPYLFLKEVYEQTRLSSIYDNNPPKPLEEEFDF